MRPGRRRLRFLLAGVLLLVGALVAVFTLTVPVPAVQRVYALQDGVRTVGTFHAEGANCWRHRCWVEFEADGKPVEADLPWITSAKRHKVRRDDEPITIRYQASDPTVAVEDSSRAPNIGLILLPGMFALALIFGGLVELVRALRVRTPSQPS